MLARFDGEADGVTTLTPRERDVLRAIVELAHETGSTSQVEIARRLVVSGRTVQTHMANMLRKAKVRDKASLVVRFMGRERQMDVSELVPEERETHIYMTGDDHNLWEAYTDDPYWMRRLDKVATAYRTGHRGGKYYKLDASQITVRAKPKELSAEEKERRAALMRQVRAKNSVNSLDSGTLSGEVVVVGVAQNGIEGKATLCD